MTIVLPNSEPYGGSIGAAVTATLRRTGSGPTPPATVITTRKQYADQPLQHHHRYAGCKVDAQSSERPRSSHGAGDIDGPLWWRSTSDAASNGAVTFRR
jgi:hypothetical protein